ncbi:MAG: hypothetical protein ABI239_06650 [Aquihabitans sp.]
MTPQPEKADEPAARSGVKPLTVLWALVSVVVLVGAIGVWIAMDRDDAPAEEGHTLEIVVPAGTKARQNAGEKVVVMDDHIELQVGDRMVISNEDVAPQTVGPYSVKPGEVTTVKYGFPGVYEGYCELSEGKRYQIVVTE